MRKLLMSILVSLLLIGSAFFMVNGMIKIDVKGFKGISEKDAQIEQKITELSNVITVTYKNTESNLKKAANTMQESKTEYENQAILSSSNGSSYASQLESYDIDYLWTRLGNYAKEERVVIKIELVVSGTSKNLYDLNFTVSGPYVNTTDFIYDIENDSNLGFKIDNFRMVSAEGSNVTTLFSCTEIPIEVGSIETGTADEKDEKEDTTNSNTTNSTTTNTTENTTTNTASRNESRTNSTTTTSNVNS